MDEKPGNAFKIVMTVVGINLGVLLLYSGLLYLVNDMGNSGDGVFPIGMLLSAPLHAIGCFIAAIVYFILQKVDYGLGFLLSSFMVAILGFSICLGGMSGMQGL